MPNSPQMLPNSPQMLPNSPQCKSTAAKSGPKPRIRQPSLAAKSKARSSRDPSSLFDLPEETPTFSSEKLTVSGVLCHSVGISSGAQRKESATDLRRGFSIWENSGGLIADSTTVTSCKKLVEYAEKSTSTEDLTKEDESIKIETVKDEDTVEIIKHWDSITLNHVETLGSSTCSERSSRWHGEYVDDEECSIDRSDLIRTAALCSTLFPGNAVPLKVEDAFELHQRLSDASTLGVEASSKNCQQTLPSLLYDCHDIESHDSTEFHSASPRANEVFRYHKNRADIDKISNRDDEEVCSDLSPCLPATPTQFRRHPRSWVAPQTNVKRRLQFSYGQSVTQCRRTEILTSVIRLLLSELETTYCDCCEDNLIPKDVHDQTNQRAKISVNQEPCVVQNHSEAHERLDDRSISTGNERLLAARNLLRLVRGSSRHFNCRRRSGRLSTLRTRTKRSRDCRNGLALAS